MDPVRIGMLGGGGSMNGYAESDTLHHDTKAEDNAFAIIRFEDGGIARAEVKHFVDCVRNGETARETYHVGWVVNTILDAMNRSSKSRRWEPINLED